VAHRGDSSSMHAVRHRRGVWRSGGSVAFAMPPTPSRTARHALGASIIALSLLIIDATTLRAQRVPSGMTKVAEGVYVIVHRDATEE
jgi:hypothetical protein